MLRSSPNGTVPPACSESLSPVEVTPETISFGEFQERYRLPWQRSVEKELDAEILKIGDAFANLGTGRTLFNPAVSYEEFRKKHADELNVLNRVVLKS